jgi:hypothetical protein
MIALCVCYATTTTPRLDGVIDPPPLATQRATLWRSKVRQKLNHKSNSSFLVDSTGQKVQEIFTISPNGQT